MIAAALTALGLSQRVARVAAPLIGIAAVALLVWVLWARGSHFKSERDEAREDLARARAEIVLLNTQAALVETAAEERVADTAAVATAEKELIDAIAQVPDTMPDAVRVSLGCERLRRAGHLDADLPAECGPGRGVEAEAAAGDPHQHPRGG